MTELFVMSNTFCQTILLILIIERQERNVDFKGQSGLLQSKIQRIITPHPCAVSCQYQHNTIFGNTVSAGRYRLAVLYCTILNHDDHIWTCAVCIGKQAAPVCL